MKLQNVSAIIPQKFSKYSLDTQEAVYYNITVRREKYAHTNAPEWSCGNVFFKGTVLIDLEDKP